MKIAGGILLIIGGALGVVGDIMLIVFGSVVGKIASDPDSQMSTADLSQIKQNVPVLKEAALVDGIFALALLVLGTFVLSCNKTWQGLVAIVLTIVYFFLGSHFTGVLCLIGGILAYMAASNASKKDMA